MEWLEADPLPMECQNCNEEDCYNCDYAGKRWYLSQEDALRIRRKGLIKAIERLQRQVDAIDRQLLLAFSHSYAIIHRKPHQKGAPAMILRAFCEEDAGVMLDILTDASVGQTYMLPDFETRTAAIPLFRRLMELSRSKEHFVRAICRDGAPVGFLNDVEIRDQAIELGYVIHPAHQRKGYATAALKAAIAALFAAGYREVLCGAFAENAASVRVMEKAGMTPLPKTEQIEYRGKVHDCVYYGKRCSSSDTVHEKRS